MRYTTIIYEVKKELGLSLREYIYLDAIYHLQNQSGWCFAKSSYFGELLDIGDREVRKIRLNLVEKGLIIMSDKYNSNEIKTTEKWNLTYLIPAEQKVHISRTKKSADAEQKVHSTIDKEIDKEIYNKETTKVAPKYSPLGAEVIKAMETIDPKNKRYYGNTTQREACEFLIQEYSLEGVMGAINFYIAAYGKVKYLPSISTPCELRDKWHKLQGLLARKGAESSEQFNNAVW